MGGLVALPIGPCRFSEGRHITQHVEQIVLNLKGQADGRCIIIERRVGHGIETRRALGGHQDACADDGPRLPRMHVLHLRDVELLPLHSKIDGLAAGHAERTDGLCQHVDQL